MSCVLVAAGSGERLGAGRPKAFVELRGLPLLWYAVASVARAGGTVGPAVDEVVVVAPGDRLDQAREVATAAWDRDGRVAVVAGGRDRSASVRAGLDALSPGADVVAVHDAARCLAPPQLHAEVVAAVRAGADAVVPGLPVVDTIKEIVDDGPPPWPVVATHRRHRLRAVQTPQAFRRPVLERAHARTAGARSSATDDAGLVEALGGQVVVVPGHPDAFKITSPPDLDAALAVLDRRRPGVGRG